MQLLELMQLAKGTAQDKVTLISEKLKHVAIVIIELIKLV